MVVFAVSLFPFSCNLLFIVLFFSVCFLSSILSAHPCSFHWGRIVNVAVVGVIPLVSYHAVSFGPLGMHVFVWSAEAGAAYGTGFLSHYVLI